MRFEWYLRALLDGSLSVSKWEVVAHGESCRRSHLVRGRLVEGLEGQIRTAVQASSLAEPSRALFALFAADWRRGLKSETGDVC